MKGIRQKLLSVILIVSLFIGLVGVVNVDTTYAAERLTKGSYGFYYFDPEDNDSFYLTCRKGETFTLCNDNVWYELIRVKSSSSDILKVCSVDTYDADIKAIKKGTATLYVYLQDDNFEDCIVKIKVTVQKAKEPKRTVKLLSKLYMSTTKTKVKVTNVKKGDTVKLKIGKKTYSKKITKKASKRTLTFTIKRPNTYGKKYKLTITNSKKNTVATKSGYIYSYRKIRKGLTKKQVKWIPHWGSPDYTASASGGWSYWYYDYGSTIRFKNGRVNSWYDVE